MSPPALGPGTPCGWKLDILSTGMTSMRRQTPEAGLGWVVAWDKGDFIGKQALAAAKEKGVSRRLAGFKMFRAGDTGGMVSDPTGGEEVGVVTSGTMRLLLKLRPSAWPMCGPTCWAGTELEVLIRNKPSKAQIVKRPFIKPSVKR